MRTLTTLLTEEENPYARLQRRSLMANGTILAGFLAPHPPRKA